MLKRYDHFKQLALGPLGSTGLSGTAEKSVFSLEKRGLSFRTAASNRTYRNSAVVLSKTSSYDGTERSVCSSATELQ